MQPCNDDFLPIPVDGVGDSRGDGFPVVFPVSCNSTDAKGGDSSRTGKCTRGNFPYGDLRGDGLPNELPRKLARKDFPTEFPVDGVSGVSTGRGSTEESWRDGFLVDSGEPRRGDGFPVKKDFPAEFPVDGVSGVSTGRGSTEEPSRDGFSGDSGEPRRGDGFRVNSGGDFPAKEGIPVKPRFPAAWGLANEKAGGGAFEVIGDGANDLSVPGLCVGGERNGGKLGVAGK